MKDKVAIFIAFVLVFVSFTPTISMPIKLVMCLICCALIFRYAIILNYKDFYLVIPFLIIIILSTIFDFINFSIDIVSLTNLYFLFCILFGWLCAKSELCPKILSYSERIIFTFALVSLVIGIFVYLNQSVVKLFFDYTYYHTSHKTLYVMNFLVVDGVLVERNTGFASEPGLYQYLLNAGFAIYFFLANKNKKCSNKRFYLTVSIYFACILSTNSTAGLICFFSIIIFYLISAKAGIKFLIIIIALLISPVLIEVIFYHFTVKLDFAGDSFISRAAPAFNIFTQHLTIFGKGTTYYDIYNEELFIGSFDTYSQITLRFGVLGLFLYLIMTSRNFKSNFTVSLIIILTSFGQAIWFLPFTILLIYSNLNILSDNSKIE